MPDWKAEIRAQLGELRLAPERELELVEELEAHLDDLYRESLAAGATPEKARQEALAALAAPSPLPGRLQPLRQAQSRPRVVPGEPTRGLLGDLWQDVRYGLRGLRARPGFTLAGVLTLALGIGANSAIFSVVSAVLLQRLPLRDSQRVVHVRGTGGNVLSYPEYADLRDHQTPFEGFAASGGITVSLKDGGEARLAQGLIVTGNYFELLGVEPALGRLLAPSDDVTPGAHPVVVLDHAFWRSELGARPDVVGRDLRLNGQRFTVVGVTAPGFTGTDRSARPALYVPMMMQAIARPPRAGYSGEMDPDLLKRRGSRWLTGLGRLKPGRTLQQAASEMSTLATSQEQALPAEEQRGAIRMSLVPVDVGDAAERARLSSVATLLMAVVGAVLLLACANVANLLLSRAAARRREIAVRLALGASRLRLVRQLLTESVLLACCGGLAGLLFAALVLAAFEAAPPPAGALPIALQARLDPRVLLFTLALAVAAGVAFGLAPALTATRSELVPVLKDESFVPDERARRLNLRGGLVVAQVALSVLLLVAAGLFLRNLREIQAVAPGFDTERLLSTQLPVNLLRYTTEQGREFYRRVVEQVEALPGVESAAVARVALLGGGGRSSSLNIEGRPGPANRYQSEGGGNLTGRSTEAVNSNVVGPGYFRTLGIVLRAGRVLDERDADGAPLTAVVSDAFCRLHFPDRPRERVLGQRFSLNGPEGPWREIVGVVGDTKYGSLTEELRPVVFLPLGQRHETGVVLYVRASGNPAALVPAVRAAVRGLEPNLPLAELRTLGETVSASTWAARTGVALLAAFAGLALALAAIGVYGVTSFQVSQRTREIGVRMALGARGADVRRMVLGGGMRLVALGIALGLLLALLAGRSLESLLYGVSGRDPLTLAAVPVILAAVACGACLLAARRATRLDPLAALRSR